MEEIRGEGDALQKKSHHEPGRYPSLRHPTSFRASMAHAGYR